MSTLLRATGLQTYVNNLGSVKEGSLEIADNVIIDKPGVIEPRRGLNEYGEALPHNNDRVKQLMVYKGRLLRHYFDNTLVANKIQVDDGTGDFSILSGTFNETEAGLRIKSTEANSNFYFTTDAGVKKLSARSASDLASTVATTAGGIKATDVTATIDYSTPGFFSPKSKVSYAVTWVLTDNNGNVIEGTPSTRFVLTNYSDTQSAVSKIYITIPSGVTTDYVYRIYRTPVFEAGLLDLDEVDPGSEHQLVIERSYADAITNGLIISGRIVETDITPEDFRSGGLPLYTNPISGEGIENANEPPPLSKDITLFKGVVFYANTITRHRLSFNLLSVDDIISGTHKFILSNGVTTREYTFIGTPEITPFTIQVGTTGATLAGKYFTLNAASDERQYYIWYNTGGSTDPLVSGRIGIEVVVLAGDTENTLASKTKVVLDDVIDFSCVNSTNTFTVTNLENGSATDATVGSIGSPVFTIGSITQGTGEDLSTGKILLSASGSVGQAVDTTARSLVRVINADTLSPVNAYYLSGEEDVPGEILLESRTVTDTVFFIAVNASVISDQFSPALPHTHTITANTAANPTVVTSIGHGLVNNDSAIIYGSNSTPVIDGVRTITYISANTFSVAVNVTIAGTTGTFFKGSVFSDNEESVNTVYFSKYQQPEAVPLINFIPIGKKDAPIYRILPLRDSLFIFKGDGLFRLSGNPGNFQVTLFDTNVEIAAPDTAVVLNNQIYLLAHDGVTLVTESGASIISWDIKDLIDEALQPDHTDNSTASFGVNYDSDHSYLLWVTTNPEDTYATQVYRYNFFTETWTRWIRSDRCGIINSMDNKLYVGSAVRNYVDQERKNFNRKDYADRELPVSVVTNGIDVNVVQLTSGQNIDIGDAINQIQYLSLFEFNQVLSKLSTDSLAPAPLKAGILAFTAVPGDSLRNSVNSLATFLQAQLGGTYTPLPNGGASFAAIQEDFNYLVVRLNLDSQLYQSNFKQSVGTKSFDYRIDTIVGNKVTLRFSPLLITGPAMIIKSIHSKVRYSPVHFGDPATLKQVNQGTYIFDNRNAFSSATVSYATDLSTGLESIPFEFPGAGIWGQFTWSEMTWGGERNYAPMRTLLPQQKQRCRFVIVQFEHGNAYERFSLLGISLEPRVLSERAYL